MQQDLAFIFPGQGSQKEGMLAELATEHTSIQATFNEASEILGYDLWSLCQSDPENKLSLTHITQPAILTASVALWRLWLEQGGYKPGLMAGHSLGEYSALVCGGILAFEDAVMLVQKRGEFMQSAVPVGIGTMAAIVGLADADVIAACEEAAQGEVVGAVNFNSPGQVVIAGHVDAVNRAIESCKAKGAKRALPLPVSAPFHSALMQPAADRFAEVLNDISLSAPRIPVLQNYSLALTADDTNAIKESLIKQIYSPVPWVETINRFAQQGVERVIEIGPGRVLSGLNKRIAPEMKILTVNDSANLAAALKN
ncbi:ACP S-malonyltransferase [Haliea sp. AH-315-K21]|uniref:Malonyl CoA-acyl carrier protein transacylase n=1 Tax=SAR86 cluster bacterium TaxID=2030880 RepID=A0A2A5CF31_9GAMM|nr:ACP S-malonyltransferase [Haliea sp. AH-315-K21]PCJ42111.1 MAG: [acyl-carrier-protein] S-malonyltransferase [SAR86 cluster bacterium]